MRRFNKIQIHIVMLVLALSFLSACTLFTQTKPLTAAQQASIWMIVYNATYDDTMAMAINPSATPAQKEMVAKKKAILTPLWPALKIYVAVVESGGTPSAESTAYIVDLINQLAALAGGK